MSYEISHDLYLGVNGYALRQLTDDRTNGQNVPGSRETAVSIGPGARYVFDASKALNVNLYLPVVAENTSSGIEVNFQFVKRF
jgi:hypothetical protein